MKSSRSVFSPEAAALSVPAKAYSYRFILSVCVWVIAAYLSAMGGSSYGIFIVVLLNLLFCGDVLFRNAWKDAERARLSLSVLVACCVAAAFGYGISKTFFVNPLAGSVSAPYLFLISLVVLYLWTCSRSAREKECTGVFIKKLDDFLPKSGRLLTGRREHMVFARELNPQDIIRVKAGERIPCEGVIAQGNTSIDESLITGNMRLTAKNTGSRVYAGTLNKGKEILVRVEKTLDQSVIAGIIGAIKNSERRRRPRRDPLDAYAPWILLLTIFLATAAYAFFYWRGDYSRPLHNLGILLLTLALGCPLSLFFCAYFPACFVRLGAKRRKIDLQALGALESLEEANVVFFDKTGTLTYGELRVASVHASSEKARRDLLIALATAEQLVDGPFANAIHIYAAENHISAHKLLCFDVFPGLGVKARSGKNTFLAGRPEWLKEQGITLSDKPGGEQTVICGAKNGVYLGYVLLDDKLRPGAAEMVAALKQLGKEIVLMSGDNEASVSAIAAEAGIDKINFGVLPQTKAEILGNYHALGKKTVMVGDGFNDITALLRAEAGVVFSSGRNVYNNWVDIIIRRGDLGSVTELFSINRKLSACTNGNIFLSLLCNLTLIGALLFAPIEAGYTGYLLTAGTLGSIAVVFLHSARLLNIK